MSGHAVRPDTQSQVIAMFAHAYWEELGFDHTTHYLEVSLPESAITVFEKTYLADMKDDYIDRCAAREGVLVVLVVTENVGDGLRFMVLSLPMEKKS